MKSPTDYGSGLVEVSLFKDTWGLNLQGRNTFLYTDILQKYISVYRYIT